MTVLSIARGSTLETVTTAKRSGVAQDLTGCRIVFLAKVNASDPDSAAVAMLDNASLGGINVPTPSSGVFQIIMPDTATYSLPTSVRGLYYEIWIRDAAGLRWQTENGSIQLTGRALVQQP
jgi:hypothetical protein